MNAYESLAVGQEEKESEIAQSSFGTRAVTMVRISHEDVATGREFALLEDSEDIEELQKVFKILMPRVQTSKVISPNFLITLGALNEEERESEKLGPKTQKAIIGLSAFVNFITSSLLKSDHIT